MMSVRFHNGFQRGEFFKACFGAGGVLSVALDRDRKGSSPMIGRFRNQLQGVPLSAPERWMKAWRR